MAAQLLQQVLGGLLVGALYSLMAVGLTLLRGAMARPLRPPRPALVATWLLIGLAAWWPGWLGWAGTLLAAAALVGLASELAGRRRLVGPLPRRPELGWVLGAMAFFLLLLWADPGLGGPAPTFAPFGGRRVAVGPASVGVLPLVCLHVAIFTLAGARVYLGRTRRGRAFLAAGLAGLGGDGGELRHRLGALALGGVLLALGGLLDQLVTLPGTPAGLLPWIKAAVLLTLAGAGHLPWAMLGAYLLGLGESLGGPDQLLELKQWIALALVLLALVLRPAWLFRRKSRPEPGAEPSHLS